MALISTNSGFSPTCSSKLYLTSWYSDLNRLTSSFTEYPNSLASTSSPNLSSAEPRALAAEEGLMGTSRHQKGPVLEEVLKSLPRNQAQDMGSIVDDPHIMDPANLLKLVSARQRQPTMGFLEFP